MLRLGGFGSGFWVVGWFFDWLGWLASLGFVWFGLLSECRLVCMVLLFAVCCGVGSGLLVVLSFRAGFVVCWLMRGVGCG